MVKATVEVKLKSMYCEKCGAHYEADLNNTPFQTQILMLNGKTQETRSYMTKCTACGERNLFQTDNPSEWGNQKSISVRKIQWLFGGSCLLFLIIVALVFYFAGQGIVTIFEWIGN